MGDSNRNDTPVNKLHQFFVITDQERPTHFLGVKISFKRDGIFLLHAAYICQFIQMANMTNLKPTKHPLPMSQPLHEDIAEPSQ